MRRVPTRGARESPGTLAVSRLRSPPCCPSGSSPPSTSGLDGVRFGRHICAVGGNAEASRRAGIKVRRVRVVVFALCSAMAAVGGIMAASRLFAVNQSSGGSDLLLLAIAGPVIAGTSQGVRSALLDDVVAVVESLRREETAAIGIGVPSIVELATGRIRYSLNIPLIDLPLREILTERIGSGHRGRRVNGRQPAARSRARDRTPFRVSRGRHRMRNPPRSHRGRSRNPRRRAAGQDRAQATRCHQLLTVSTGRCSRFASAARVRAGYRESCRVSASTGSPGAPAARPRRALAGFAGGSVGGDQPAEEALREPVGMCSDETWSVPPSATKLNSDHVTRVHSPQVTNVNCLLGRKAVSHNRSPGSPHRSRTRTVRRTTFT
jgi:hypothetical protein